jgi:hypothetical protein
MKAQLTLRAALVSGIAISSVVLASACATSVDESLFEGVLLAPDAQRSELNACPDTTCPAPWATCPGEKTPCSVDVRNDIDHCGACDTACPKPGIGTHGSYVCTEGKCQLACDPFRADCNADVSDGCETRTGSDPKNCGACGAACSDGVICWKGACGCPNGYTQCGDDCKKLDSDDDNCAACGQKCKAPDDANDPRWICGPKVQPDNTKWTCSQSACNIQCKPLWGNCNNDMCSDGCETNLKNDPKNCGACGRACSDGQQCINGSCLCPPGLQFCGGECVDLAKDPANCGTCGYECPGPSATRPGQKQVGGGPLCEQGDCKYVCFPGWADCDGKITNGCEAQLDRDQKNCGGCGIACDIAAGQPCVGGKCLTKACERGLIH